MAAKIEVRRNQDRAQDDLHGRHGGGRFVEDGFVRIEGAFPPRVAEHCARLLWRETGYDPDDPATWKDPVVWVTDAEFREIAAKAAEASAHRPLAHATGRPGDVYLCHPFLVHAAQPHHGTRPRFMAQPPLMTAVPDELERADGAYSAVELTIRRGLAQEEA